MIECRLRQNIGFCYALLFFLFVNRIQFTYAADGCSSSTKPSDDTDTTNNTDIRTHVDLAINTFIDEYESRHGVTLTVDRQPKPADEFEAGLSQLSGTFRLEFSFRKRDDNNNQEQRSSVILKIPEVVGFRYDYGKKLFFYEKEKFMYEKVFPLMYRSWPNEKLSPQLYLVTEKSRLFFLENLHEDGFRTTKGELLNSPEMCKRVMESLAQFHALSTGPLEDDDEEDTMYQNLVALTNTSGADLNFHPKFRSLYMAKFERYVTPSLTQRMKYEVTFTFEQLQSILVSGYSPSENGFDVILHGDPNHSNVFFPSDERRSGETAGCKFIDFYLSRPGSPIIDIMNYLLTSVQFDVFETDRDTLFLSYVQEFGRAVPEGRDKYDRLQLYQDLRTYKSYFVYKLIFAVPLYWRNAMGVTAYDENTLYDQVLGSERYQSFFKDWMEYLMNM